MTISQNDQQCAWLTSPVPESLCDLVLLSTKSSLRLPLVLAVAASPRLAHLLAGHAVHEQVCVLIPNYCRHTMLALYHLITTGATFSLNTRHMAELKEVCSLIGFGQVTRKKKNQDRGRVAQAVSTQQGSAPSEASQPSEQVSGTAGGSEGGEGKEHVTTVTTAGNDDLILADIREDASKISPPAVLSPSQCLASSYPAPNTEPSDDISDRNEGDDDDRKELNNSKSRLRSSAVAAASKKLAETAAGRRTKKFSQQGTDSRQQLAQCQSKPGQHRSVSVAHSQLADPAVQKRQDVRQKSSAGLDINYNDCGKEKFKVVIGHHGEVLFKLRPRSVCKKYSGRRSLKCGDAKSLKLLDQLNHKKPPKPVITSVPTSAGCDTKAVILKGCQSVYSSKESGGNFEFTPDAPLKCRSTNSYTKLSCKKPKLNIPLLDIKTTNPKPPSQSMLTPSSTKYSCPQCLKSSPSQFSIYPDQTSYKQHLTKMHFLQKIINLFPGPDMVCHLCTSSSKFPSKHLLAMHLGTAHSLSYSFVDNNFSCGICDQTFQNGNKFKMHLFSHYRSQLNNDFKEVIKCPFCSFWSVHNLPRHMGVFHGLVFKYYDPVSFMLITPGNADKPGQDEGLVEVITLD